MGEKTPGSRLCSFLTCFFYFLIFPIFFCLCGWWKAIVRNKYSCGVGLYRAVAGFVQSVPTCTKFTLSVCDNNLTREKVAIIREGLRQSNVREFHLVNLAMELNWKEDEFDNFPGQVAFLRELDGVAVKASWDSLVYL